MDLIDVMNTGEPWMRDAVCASSAVNVVLFASPSDAEEASYAAEQCASCPVLAACAAYAEHHDPVGVWAGEWRRRGGVRRAAQA